MMAEFPVPPPPMRGRQRPVPLGEEEGELCGRNASGYETCLANLELRHNTDFADDGCRCWISPPCAYCLSEVPECPNCGWRAEEP